MSCPAHTKYSPANIHFHVDIWELLVLFSREGEIPQRTWFPFSWWRGCLRQHKRRRHSTALQAPISTSFSSLWVEKKTEIRS